MGKIEKSSNFILIFQVDLLNEKLTASGSGITEEISEEVKEKHAKQVAALRDEISQKSKEIEELMV